MRAFVLAVALVLAAPAHAQDAVDLELVLAADVAGFMLKQLSDDAYLRQAPALSY